MFSHPSKIQLRVDKKVKINLKLIYIKPIKALYKPARNNKIWFITLILRYILPVYNRFTNIASNSLPNFWIVCLPRRTKNQQGCSRNYLRTILSLFLKTYSPIFIKRHHFVLNLGHQLLVLRPS